MFFNPADSGCFICRSICKDIQSFIWIPSREQGGLMQIFPFPSATPEPNSISSPVLQENTCCSLFPQSLPLISPIASLPWSAALPQTPNTEGTAWKTTGHSGQESWQLNCTSLPLFCSSKSNSLISYLALRQNIYCYPTPIFSSSHPPLQTSSLSSLLCLRPQLLLTLPWYPQGILIREASRLTVDLHLFLHSSKSYLLVFSPSLFSLDLQLGLSSLSAPFPREKLNRSWCNTFLYPLI